MRFSHIMWDFDGTLFDTYPIMAEAFQRILREDGMDEPLDSISTLMKVSMGHALSYYKEKYEIGGAFLERFKALSLFMQQENVKPFEGIPQICRTIHENGGSNHLYTHRGESAVHFMEKFGLEKLFTELIMGKNGFPRKPSPDALLWLAQKYRFEPGEAIMIGDRDMDILSAKNAGIHSCFFSEDGKLFRKADFNISRIDSLYSILEL